jgi:hypothetical protein
LLPGYDFIGLIFLFAIRWFVEFGSSGSPAKSLAVAVIIRNRDPHGRYSENRRRCRPAWAGAQATKQQALSAGSGVIAYRYLGEHGFCACRSP